MANNPEENIEAQQGDGEAGNSKETTTDWLYDWIMCSEFYWVSTI
jgi:hypothetical protein